MSRLAAEDVPCLSCQHGYGKPHECDVPDYCACDQWRTHHHSLRPGTAEPVAATPPA